jgi:hypothetical protein
MKERNEKGDTGIRKARRGEAKSKNWNRIRRISGKERAHVRKCSQRALICYARRKFVLLNRLDNRTIYGKIVLNIFQFPLRLLIETCSLR